nr:DUF87 domain-containing protein [Pyrinomonadaceae bacterium]
MTLEKGIEERRAGDRQAELEQWFRRLVQKSEYVGDLFAINYETASVVIHDSDRQKVGGIPSLSFLIATRVDPDNCSHVDFKNEDSSFILLRVMDSARLPFDQEAERIRVETAQRVSGETELHWDSEGAMDPKTRVLLGFAGIRCRIIGTFFLDAATDDADSPLTLRFGSDISNYYPNRGLKIYKPNARALEAIVNFSDPASVQDHLERYGNTEKVKLGNVRYASTNRKYQQVDDVPVSIYPADLLSQKTALFGMTRTGKSNTTKIIAKSVFELRSPHKSENTPLRIGQLIFDPNGEYANENVQDNNNALKNIWRSQDSILGAADKLASDLEKETDDEKRQVIQKAIYAEIRKEVVTYGITTHPSDPGRILMLLNFYEDDNLQIGKEIIDSLLSEDSVQYIKNFCQISFEPPDPTDRSALTRYNRRVLAYRSVLARAGFEVPSGLLPSTRGLFNRELITAMRTSTS